MKKSSALFFPASFGLLLLAFAAPAGAEVRLDPFRTVFGGFRSPSSGGSFRFQPGRPRKPVKSSMAASGIPMVSGVQSASVSGALSLHQAQLTLDDTFRLGDAYSFPNPARGKNPTLHMECGLADSLEIRIYNIAGELVHTRQLSGAEWQVVNGRYAYEYLWDVSGTASGVYIYKVRAKKSGSPDIDIRSKLAVIK